MTNDQRSTNAIETKHMVILQKEMVKIKQMNIEEISAFGQENEEMKRRDSPVPTLRGRILRIDD